MDLNEKAVLRTILYADVFDCPFSIKRFPSFLISPQKISQRVITNTIHSLVRKKILEQNGMFLYLPKKNDVLRNIPDEHVRKEKMKLAKKAVDVLSSVPTIQFIGISGGLSTGMIHEEDDIDLFLIVKNNTLWTSRIVSLLILDKIGMLRKQNSSTEKNKICLNMFLSDNSLEFPKYRQDMYTAHEIMQCIPMYSQNYTYKKFLQSNSWIKYFLANASGYTITNSEKRHRSLPLESYPMVQLAKFFQKLKMIRTKTTETVTDSLFAFHPYDYRTFVLREYTKRLRAYNL